MALKNGTKKNDTLTGTAGNDTINGLAGVDKLSGGAGNDVLDGGIGNDILNGDKGNDTLLGNLGSDKMTGGNGDDYYFVDNARDSVVETNANLKVGGNDTIETTLLTYTLPNNVENLILSGSKATKAVGNKADNRIVGSVRNDTLNGMQGNDFLMGGNGNDTALFNNAKNQYQITPKTNADGTTQITVKFIGAVKNGVVNDGEDILTNIEFLKFSDVVLSAKDIFTPKIELPVVEISIPKIPAVEVLPVPVSSQNFETKAPFVYQTNNINQLDSITTLLTYSPDVKNGIDYSTFEPEQWRIRASDAALAFDLTQTDKTTNSVTFQGKLTTSNNAQTWYKIHLTEAGTLNVQDLSQDSDVIDAALFTTNSEYNGLTYYGSFFDSSEQLKRYQNLSAGDYVLRIDKGGVTSNNDARLNQSVDFNVLLNVEPSEDYLLPALQFNAKNSTIHAELLPQHTNAYYKFTFDKTSTFTLDTTSFAREFDIGFYKFAPNGKLLIGTIYTYFHNAPAAHIYELGAGTYYLKVAAIPAFSDLKTLDIPVIADSISFNTTFNVTVPQTLKADIANPQMPFQRDADGNLVLTYSFDLNKIPNSVDAKPSSTKFSDSQQQATRSAFQDYANIAKLKFVEVPNGSSEKADITFANVSYLSDGAADTSTPTSWMNDFENALISVDLSEETNLNVNVGRYGYTTLLHEIGHALGLKHPGNYNGNDVGGQNAPFLIDAKDNDQYTLMSYNQYVNKTTDGYDLNTNTAAVSAKTPLLYDVAAIQSLYGANTNYKNDDTVYRWDVDVNPRMTVWDSGGVDTIDASNQTQVQTIDLRAGEFSSIGASTLMYDDNSTELYPAKDNFSIAYDTVIENAIGGSANDTLIGNSVANQLTGNAGSDNFVFTSKLSAFNVDIITDFSPQDKLTLNHSIFGGVNGGNQLKSEEFLIGNNVTAAENTLQRIIFNALNHSLFYDSDGFGGVAPVEFAILSNVTQLNANQIFMLG